MNFDTANARVDFRAPATQGASEVALFVAAQLQANRLHFQSSYTFGCKSRGVFDDLFAAAESAREAGWDGYGAEPVSQDAYDYAYRFLESLPLGTPSPVVTAEPDGQLAFEWYASPYRTLSVSVSREGDLHYSALFGPSNARGTEVFLGEAPKPILDLIRRVHAA